MGRELGGRGRPRGRRRRAVRDLGEHLRGETRLAVGCRGRGQTPAGRVELEGFHVRCLPWKAHEFIAAVSGELRQPPGSGLKWTTRVSP